VEVFSKACVLGVSILLMVSPLLYSLVAILGK
jgi:hypothetical protein